MTSYRSLDFWAPALHPNTLLSLSVPEPGPSRDPIVKHYPIKHGDHAPVGVIQRIASTSSGLLVADDQFRVSALTLPTPEDETSVPVVTSQAEHAVPPATRGPTIWSGLTSIGNGNAVSSLSSGRLTLYKESADVAGSNKVGLPILTLCAPDAASSSPGIFALGGRELEISVWDAERSFDGAATGKRKNAKDLAPGEIWRAKNVPSNNLDLRVPVHHLASAFLPGSGTEIVTGTKSGAVRRYDTRQRKPTADWKVAREGGVRAVAPGSAPHELFFADHSNFVGSLDLRTGRFLYSIQGLAATTSGMLALPQPDPAFSEVCGLATISSDATLRVCGTTPPPVVAPKGNWGTERKKGTVAGSVGGVGVGAFVFAGFGTHVEAPKPKAEGEEDEESDDDVDDDEEEDMWEGMGEAGDDDDGSDEDDESSDEDAPAKKRRK